MTVFCLAALFVWFPCNYLFISSQLLVVHNARNRNTFGIVSENNTKEIASLVCFYQIMHNKASNKYHTKGEGGMRMDGETSRVVHQTRRRRSGSFRKYTWWKFDLFSLSSWCHQSSCNPWQFILFHFVVEAESTELFWSVFIHNKT